jgi:hypothetical protein
MKLKISIRNFGALAALAVSLALAGLLTGGANAASNNQTGNTQANGFIISPVRTEVTVSKGHSQSVQLSVTNPAARKVKVKAVVNDFVASHKENGTPRLILNNSAPLPANSFKTLVEKIPNLTLKPKQKQYINVTISVPKDANSGGYYGAVRFVPANTNNKSNVGLTASVGSLFLVTVPGKLVKKANLAQLSTADSNGNPTSFLTSGDVSVLTKIKNVGNIHVQPFGKVTVKNMFGSVVQTYEFNKAKGNVLPNTTRKFVKQLKDHNWFGWYTIDANLAYQKGSGKLLSSSTTFYYFPVWSLIVAAIIILLIIAGIYRLVTRHSAKKSKSNKKK